MRCIRMELGEPDSSGRRRPIPIEGSEYEMPMDTVVMALGTRPNPLVFTDAAALERTRTGTVVANQENGRTRMERVWAGGDIVTGAATVISAMGAGRIAASDINAYLANPAGPWWVEPTAEPPPRTSNRYSKLLVAAREFFQGELVMDHTWNEIHEQPEALERLLSAEARNVQTIAAAIRASGVRWALLAARGTSDHAAVYAQYLLGLRHRLPAALATPSLYTLYETSPRLVDTLVIGISQSGRSPDVVAVLDAARIQGQLTVAITNEPESPLARAARFVLPLHAGPEQSVAATKIYTTELPAVAMLSAALGRCQAV